MTRQLDIYGHPYSLIVYIFIWLQEDSNFLAPAKATIDLPSLCCKEKTCLRESKSTECLLLLVRYSSLLGNVRKTSKFHEIREVLLAFLSK